MTRRYLSILILAAAVVMSLTATDAYAQRRDCFTGAELDLVRDAQDIDLRLKILVKAIDRRLALLNLDSGPAEKPSKDTDKWGPAPTGTRAELMTDVKRILQKAVDDIDDTSAHAGTKLARDTENPSKKDKTDPPFARAIKILLAAANRYKPVLDAEYHKSTDAAVKSPMYDAIELCVQIIEALSKLPADSKPAKN